MAALPVLAVIGFAGPARAGIFDDEPSRPLNLYPRLFGTLERYLGAGSMLPRARVLSESLDEPWPTRGQKVALLSASDAVDRAQEWSDFLVRQIGRDRAGQITAINDYCNAVPYASDRVAEGAPDYWARPEEFFRKGGDCEDYAIAKFVSLRRLGFTDQRLRVVVVFDRVRQTQHALAAVYLAGTAFILDNQDTIVRDHRTVKRYIPICSFNQASLWVHRAA